ncbi:MAG: hypothetical protein QM756_44075 [Polyangiaceae bacterium]
MSLRLVPCAACSRHVRVGSQLCPFCNAECASLSDEAVAPSARLGSLALMTFRAATLGVALSACGGQSNEPGGQGGAAGAGSGGVSTNGGASASASGGVSDNVGGSITLGNGGSTGTPSSGGSGTGGDGNGVPIYRATPRG